MSILITKSALLSDVDYPYTHARIGYDTITRDGTLTSDSEAADHPAYAAGLPNTYESWQPATSGEHWIMCDAGYVAAVDYIAIGSHTLGSSSAFIKIQHSVDGSVWTDVIEDYTTASDNSPIMVFFSETSARYWRLLINSTVQPIIGVWYVGKALASEEEIAVGHSPINLSRNTELRSNKSEGGQFLGRYIVRSGVKTSVKFDDLSDSYYRSLFDPFVRSARTYPFFFAWNPSYKPGDVAYCWTTNDISPRYSRGGGFISASMSIEGASEYEVTDRADPPGLPISAMDTFTDESELGIYPLEGAYISVLVFAESLSDSSILGADVSSGVYTDITIRAQDNSTDAGTLGADIQAGDYSDVTVTGHDDFSDAQTLGVDLLSGLYQEVVS